MPDPWSRAVIFAHKLAPYLICFKAQTYKLNIFMFTQQLSKLI